MWIPRARRTRRPTWCGSRRAARPRMERPVDARALRRAVRATLEPTPVATGIGSRPRAPLSEAHDERGPRRGRLGRPRGRGNPAAVRAAGGPGTSTPARGGGVGGGGTPSSTNGANTPRTPLSRSSSVAATPRTPRGAGADRPPSLDAPAALIPALLARNVASTSRPPRSPIPPTPRTPPSPPPPPPPPPTPSDASPSSPRPPHPKASAPPAALARGSGCPSGPPGGAGIHVYPLEGPSAIPRFPGFPGTGTKMPS